MTAVLAVQCLTAYVGLGVLCALPFALLVGRIEPSARGASLGFRLLILPGAVLLWPVIARRAALALRRSP